MTKFLDSIHVKDAFHEFWRPCRGLPRLERRVAPNGVVHMTRRALPALRVIRFQGKSCIIKAKKVLQVGPRFEEISESVSSIDFGAIFPASLGEDLSRNIGGMSVYAL